MQTPPAAAQPVWDPWFDQGFIDTMPAPVDDPVSPPFVLGRARRGVLDS